MRRGIDVSENNGHVDWQAVKEAGMDFAIIRLGYGNRHLDERFYENINGAINAGLDVGVYYYSYALDPEAAEMEANFMADILADCGMTIDKLPMGVWLDMEDADGYKARHDALDDENLTAMCVAFIEACRIRGFNCGMYASLDWLENRLDTDAFPDAPIWCAQWSWRCDWPGAAMWQFTDELEIDGHIFDGNVLYG